MDHVLELQWCTEGRMGSQKRRGWGIAAGRNGTGQEDMGSQTKGQKDKKNVLMQMLELDVDVLMLVRRSRLWWYGHVLRRDEDSGIRRVFKFEVQENRSRGCLKLSWKEQADKDRVTVRMGTQVVENRGQWRN